MNLTEHVFDSLNNWGRHPVLIEKCPGKPERIINNVDFRAAVDSRMSQLKSAGIRERMAIPLFLNNSADFSITFFALIAMNAIPVMMKMDYRSVELDEIFSNLQPEIIITEESHLNIIGYRIENRTVIVRKNGLFSVGQWGSGPNQSIEVPDDIATINYTYRGYGYPLGSLAPHDQYTSGAEVLQAGLQAENGESMLVILPMSHIFTLIGCIMVPLLFKLTSVISQTMNPRQLFSTISDNSINHVLSVPEVYEMLYRLHDPNLSLSSLKVFVSGGSYLSPENYIKYSEKFNVQVLHGYGLTEYTPASRNIRNQSRPGTIGPMCGGVGCFFDEGEILLDTPNATRGYYHRPKETSEAFHGSLFRTGDLGHMDGDHLVFDREKKRTRKINGNLVDLAEVEKTIAGFPAIDQSRLEYKEGKLTAFVSFKNRDGAFKELLRDFLIGKIARYKVPRIVTGEEI